MSHADEIQAAIQADLEARELLGPPSRLLSLYNNEAGISDEARAERIEPTSAELIDRLTLSIALAKQAKQTTELLRQMNELRADVRAVREAIELERDREREIL